MSRTATSDDQTGTGPALAELKRGIRRPTCPDCNTPIGSTKGDHPSPSHAPGESTYGYRCEDCGLVFPLKISGPEAAELIDVMVGRQATLRNGRERFIPVPEPQLEECE